MAWTGDDLGTALRVALDAEAAQGGGESDADFRERLCQAMGGAIVDAIDAVFKSGTDTAAASSTQHDITGLPDAVIDKPAVVQFASSSAYSITGITWVASPTRLRVFFSGALSSDEDLFYIVDGR